MTRLAFNPSTLKFLYNPGSGKFKTQCCDACSEIPCCCFKPIAEGYCGDPEIYEERSPFAGFGKTPERYLIVIQGMQDLDGLNVNGQHLLEYIPGLCAWELNLGTTDGGAVFYATVVLQPSLIFEIPEEEDIGFVAVANWNGRPSPPHVWYEDFCVFFAGNVFQRVIEPCQNSGVLVNQDAGNCFRNPNVSVAYAPYYEDLCENSTTWVFASAYAVGQVITSTDSAEACYICHTSHTSNDSNKPNSGANWENYWIRIEK